MVDTSETVTTKKSSGVGTVLKKYWWIILIIIILIFILVSGARTFLSPLFDALKNTFGLASAVTGSLLSQWKKCTSSAANFFNPGSGCFMGIALIGGIVLFGAYKMYGAMGGGEGNDVGKEAKALSGGSADEMIKEIIEAWEEAGGEEAADKHANELADKYNLKGEAREKFIENTKESVRKSFVNNKTKEMTKEKIDASPDSPDSKAAAISQMDQVAEEQSEKEKADNAQENAEESDMDENDAKEAAENSDSFGEQLVGE